MRRNGILFSPALASRFWAKVDMTQDCWLWTGRINPGGMGQFRLSSERSRGDQKGMRLDVHKIAYLWYVGPIPDGHEIDHLCRVPYCVRPDHLEAVTPEVNRRRATDWRRRDKLRAAILKRAASYRKARREKRNQ